MTAPNERSRYLISNLLAGLGFQQQPILSGITDGIIPRLYHALGQGHFWI